MTEHSYSSDYLKKSLKQPLQAIQHLDEGVKIGFPLSVDEKQLLQQAIDHNLGVFITPISVSTKLTKAQFFSLPIFSDIENHGKMIALYPSWELLDHSRTEEIVHLLFSSDKKADTLSELLFDTVLPVDRQNPFVRSGNRGLRILLAEDNPVSRLLAEKVTYEYGTLDTAADGEEALRAIDRAYEKGASYDLILLDIMMPRLNGQELLEKVREMEKLREPGSFPVKIIMITSLKDPSQIHRAFRSKANAYIIKPFTRQKFTKALREIGVLP